VLDRSRALVQRRTPALLGSCRRRVVVNYAILQTWTLHSALNTVDTTLSYIFLWLADFWDGRPPRQNFFCFSSVLKHQQKSNPSPPNSHRPIFVLQPFSSITNPGLQVLIFTYDVRSAIEANGLPRARLV
jgi:hypothetical protein